MKCLVTGGAGFIGSHLCDQLISLGHNVICVDNFLTGSKKNIEHLLLNPHFQFIEHDCSSPLDLNSHVELIFHFASPASPPKYQKYPIETLLVNTIGTYHLLNLAKKNGARFLFASTSEIYGDPLEHPQKETYWGHVNPVGARSCYDESKRVGETFAATFRDKFQMDVRIIRVFNTFGPRMDLDDGRVVTNFIKNLLTGKPLVIQGNGQQTRSFCFIFDLIDGIMKVAFSKKAKNEIFNLGNPAEMTVLDLADLISKIAGEKLEIIYDKLPSDDPTRRKPDITKARNLLDWWPKIDLVVGLTTTYNYYKQNSS